MRLFQLRRHFGRRESSEPSADECSNRNPTYRGLFNAAVERTERLGLLRSPVVLTDNVRYLDKASLDECLAFARHRYPAAFSRGLAFTAPFVHSGLIPAVEEFFSCRAYLTTGSRRYANAEAYPLSESTVERWLRVGVDPDKVQCHAWITLDSVEILDLTWFSTMAATEGRPELDGVAFFMNADRDGPAGSRFAHRPFLIGHEFLERIGLPTLYVEPGNIWPSPIH